MIIARGTLQPESDYEFSGGFVIERLDGGLLFKTTPDFRFGGTPGPGFAFSRERPVRGNDAQLKPIAEATDFFRIADDQTTVAEGEMSRLIPDEINLDEFNYAFLWCYPFGLLLGAAALERE
ncbi:MAG: hypothetical protein AAF141_00730 [Pseudomonadota bacterium]